MLIDFSDLTKKYTDNSKEIKDIESKGINYTKIIEQKENQIASYEEIIKSINPEKVTDFEKESAKYMKAIFMLETEIKEDKENEGKREKLAKENIKIMEDAKKRKDDLISEATKYYDENENDKDKDKELQRYKDQLAKIEKDEQDHPNKVKDAKYKEFLKKKIDELGKQDIFKKINKKNSDLLFKTINKKYLDFKKDVSKQYMPEEFKKENPVLKEAKEKRVQTKKTKPEAKVDRPKMDVKIEIGRTGKITLEGKEYNISKQDIKEGMNLTS